MTRRGLKRPELAIVDGAPGLEKALTSLWPDLPLQRCTVHKLRNLIAHAPKRLAEEIAADYADMIYADNPQAVERRRKAFLRKWRDKCEAVATSLEEAGDQLFTFTRLPVEQRARYYHAVSSAFASIGVASCAWGYRSGFRLRQGDSWLPGLVESIAAPR